MKKLLLILLFAGAAALGLWLWLRAAEPEIHHFAGVSGPLGTSGLAAAERAPLESFGGGGVNGIAVLVTDPSADWMGLVRGFKAHGIPFELTTDPEAALRHEVVLAYPSISGKVLPGAALQGLAAHVRGGGTLLTFDLAGGGLEEIFGISGQTGSRARNNLTFAGSGPVEDRRSWFNGARAEAQVGTYSLTPTTGETLARFDDGAPAAVCRRAGGRACLLGIDVGSLAQRTMNGRAELVSPQAVNGYQPGMDVLFRWLRDLYVAGESTPFLIGTAPAGYEASLILTHDVDFNRSVANSLEYADAIGGRGVSATFFVQTKYIADYNDESFFTTANLDALRRLAAKMEIGSHSVAHSRQFKSFPMGRGDERYPAYRPFVQSEAETRGGTIFGELRVSKYLLETLLGVKVRSFRPGYLADPENLPEALAATGYSYASTLTANGAMSHLPFQLAFARSGQGLLPAWEFPVTIEDERPPALAGRFDAAAGVIEKVSAQGGVSVLLLHPDVTGAKLRFEERLIDRFKGRLWIGSLGAFGNWWSARDRARIAFADGVLKVDAPDALERVTVLFPKGARRAVVLDRIRGSAEVRADRL